MRELAEEEVALVSGGEEAVEATVEPAEPPGVIGSFLRFVLSLLPPPPPPPPPPLDTLGPRG